MGSSCEEKIKFHIDEVKHLGSFVEIEAIAKEKEDRLYRQVERFMKLFGVKEDDLVPVSYSDMLMKAGVYN